MKKSVVRLRSNIAHSSLKDLNTLIVNVKATLLSTFLNLIVVNIKISYERTQGDAAPSTTGSVSNGSRPTRPAPALAIDAF